MEMFALLLPFQAFSFALLYVRFKTLCSVKLMGIDSFKLVLSNWECNVQTRNKKALVPYDNLPRPIILPLPLTHCYKEKNIMRNKLNFRGILL